MDMQMVLVFDMDGTIADFYGVENWLTYLEEEKADPYEKAEPLYDMNKLKEILLKLKKKGYKIVVTSWLAKDSSKDFSNRTRIAKLEWLEKYDFPYDEIHLIKYGTTKANCTRNLGGFQILFDDNEQVRNGWSLGATVNANLNILTVLESLV